MSQAGWLADIKTPNGFNNIALFLEFAAVCLPASGARGVAP
jgi:hypothetical protein